MKLHRTDSNLNLWRSSAKRYSELTRNAQYDSEYLRSNGLYPNIIGLIGECSELTILDVGSGSGWLLNFIRPSRLFQCDIALYNLADETKNLSIQDIRRLGFANNSFDIIVASLVMMWLEDIESACSEVYRVSKRSGRLILSLVHPYFYRTGETVRDGDFLLMRDLSKPFSISNHMIANSVGPFTYYYRSLSEYVNVLVRAGWTIKSMTDWHIDIEDYSSQHRRSKLRRTNKVPMYTFIECVKL